MKTPLSGVAIRCDCDDDSSTVRNVADVRVFRSNVAIVWNAWVALTQQHAPPPPFDFWKFSIKATRSPDAFR
jgi:hypothetical protein